MRPQANRRGIATQHLATFPAEPRAPNLTTRADALMNPYLSEPPDPDVLQRGKEQRRQALLWLLVHHAYKRGAFVLASGRHSEHYVNCKPVTLDGLGAALLAPFLLAHVEPHVAAVAGLTIGADPLVSTVACQATHVGRRLAAVIVRKQPKGHGTQSWLEGPLPPPGSTMTVLEDVVTTGGSALQAVQRLRTHGYQVQRVVAIVDREEGGRAAVTDAGLELVALFTLSELRAAHAAEPLGREPS